MAAETLAIKVGPWGGSSGNAFDVTEPPNRLESVTIQAGGSVINSFGFTYVDTEGQKHNVGPFGRSSGGEPTTFAPTEYVEKFSEAIVHTKRTWAVMYLVIETNIAKYEISDRGTTNNSPFGIGSPAVAAGMMGAPFGLLSLPLVPVAAGKQDSPFGSISLPVAGKEKDSPLAGILVPETTETPFSIPVSEGTSIVGFFGRAEDSLDAIGVYVKSSSKFLDFDVYAAEETSSSQGTYLPLQPLVFDIKMTTTVFPVKIGAWGGNGGSAFDVYIVLGK